MVIWFFSESKITFKILSCIIKMAITRKFILKKAVVQIEEHDDNLFGNVMTKGTTIMNFHKLNLK